LVILRVCRAGTKTLDIGDIITIKPKISKQIVFTLYFQL